MLYAISFDRADGRGGTKPELLSLIGSQSGCVLRKAVVMALFGPHTNICIDKHIYIYTYIHISLHIYLYTSLSIYTYIYTYTQKCTHKPENISLTLLTSK